MMDELDKIVIVKEGHGYTTYINDVHCGWGDLEDTLEVFLDYDGCNVAIETRVKEMMFFQAE